MNIPYRILTAAAAVLLILPGCGDGTSTERPTSEAPSAATASLAGSTAAVQGQGDSSSTPDAVTQAEAENRYIDWLVQKTIAEFMQPGMSQFEKTKAAFDYIIEHTSLIDPVGLDLWRVRGNYDKPPTFVENRSLSVLLFQLGKCEDYAAALTLLLQGMGLEAEYVPGLTYSTQGALVDHAWTVVKVDGLWYHVDCQLEQNISRHGSIRYRYFMRGDATLAGSHRWGQNLIGSGLLTAAQNAEIAEHYTPPACPQDYPTPQRRSCALPDSPDVQAIQAAIDAELREYESTYGPLEPLALNVVPPVFALEGYGPQD